jgi:hypothetical protein
MFSSPKEMPERKRMVHCPRNNCWEKLWPKKKKMPRGEYVLFGFAECAPECGFSLHE